jgi:hypothetical protein
MRLTITLNQEMDILFTSFHIAALAAEARRRGIALSFRSGLPRWVEVGRLRNYPRSFKCYLLLEGEGRAGACRAAIDLLDGHGDIDPHLLDVVDVMFKANYDPAWVAGNLAPEKAAKVLGAGLFFPLPLPWAEIARSGERRAATAHFLWRGARSSLRSTWSIDRIRRHRGLQPVRDVFLTCSAWAATSREDARRRNELITRLKRMPIRFAGGFRPTPDAFEAFPENTMRREYSVPGYMRMLATSRITVANRGMLGAYSWKLGEQLALGCCVLAEPNANTLPVPLRDGEHLLVLDPDLKDLESTVESALKDIGRQARLKAAATRVFDEALGPEAEASRILGEIERRSDSDDALANRRDAAQGRPSPG